MSKALQSVDTVCRGLPAVLLIQALGLTFSMWHVPNQSSGAGRNIDDPLWGLLGWCKSKVCVEQQCCRV